MDMRLDIETLILITSTFLSSLLSFFIIRLDWRRYGLLFIIAGVFGNILCYIFVKLGFYSFPRTLFPEIINMPFTEILTIFPFLVLLGVRYSPEAWAWKIPFYWGIVHVGMLAETLALLKTRLIRYEFKWDFWDSYTWWWIFLLLFEWIGGLIIPRPLRSPIKADCFRYGKALWAVFHFIVITTIFLGGYYLARIR